MSRSVEQKETNNKPLSSLLLQNIAKNGSEQEQLSQLKMEIQKHEKTLLNQKQSILKLDESVFEIKSRILSSFQSLQCLSNALANICTLITGNEYLRVAKENSDNLSIQTEQLQIKLNSLCFQNFQLDDLKLKNDAELADHISWLESASTDVQKLKNRIEKLNEKKAEFLKNQPIIQIQKYSVSNDQAQNDKETKILCVQKDIDQQQCAQSLKMSLSEESAQLDALGLENRQQAQNVDKSNVKKSNMCNMKSQEEKINEQKLKQYGKTPNSGLNVHFLETQQKQLPNTDKAVASILNIQNIEQMKFARKRPQSTREAASQDASRKSQEINMYNNVDRCKTSEMHLNINTTPPHTFTHPPHQHFTPQFSTSQIHSQNNITSVKRSEYGEHEVRKPLWSQKNISCNNQIQILENYFASQQSAMNSSDVIDKLSKIVQTNQKVQKSGNCSVHPHRGTNYSQETIQNAQIDPRTLTGARVANIIPGTYTPDDVTSIYAHLLSTGLVGGSQVIQRTTQQATHDILTSTATYETSQITPKTLPFASGTPQGSKALQQHTNYNSAYQKDVQQQNYTYQQQPTQIPEYQRKQQYKQLDMNCINEIEQQKNNRSYDSHFRQYYFVEEIEKRNPHDICQAFSLEQDFKKSMTQSIFFDQNSDNFIRSKKQLLVRLKALSYSPKDTITIDNCNLNVNQIKDYIWNYIFNMIEQYQVGVNVINISQLALLRSIKTNIIYKQTTNIIDWIEKEYSTSDDIYDVIIIGKYQLSQSINVKIRYLNFYNHSKMKIPLFISKKNDLQLLIGKQIVITCNNDFPQLKMIKL